MKNADMPINVVRGADGLPFDNDGFLESRSMATGLTKREHFAGLAMQGLMVNIGRNGYDKKSASEYAVMAADALLAELEKDE